MLIREKACGEEIDAILAPSQPPLVTALPSFAALGEAPNGWRENLATLAWPLLARNLSMYCYNCQLLRAVPLRHHRLCAPRRAATTLKSWTPRMHRHRGSQLHLSAPFWPSHHSSLARTHRHAKYMNFSPSARRSLVNACCSSRSDYLWLRLEIALWLRSAG